MFREIIKPTSTDYTIHLPEEYINQDVEILVFPLSSNKEVNSINQVNKSETTSTELNDILSSIRLTLKPEAKSMSYDEMRLNVLNEKLL